MKHLYDKLNVARESPPRIIFGYRYYWSVMDDFISLNNIRLEIYQLGNGRVLHTLAVPYLASNHGKSEVVFSDHGMVQITTGNRGSIVTKDIRLKPDEDANPVAHCGTTEIDENASEKELGAFYAVAVGAALPGLDMRMPDVFRLSKYPERLKFNVCSSLLQSLNLPAGTSLQKLQEEAREHIKELSVATSCGYALPFDWIHAGGMCAVSKVGIGKKVKLWHTRSADFFRNWCCAKGWDVECV